jgi:signal transduction histidine kinase
MVGASTGESRRLPRIVDIAAQARRPPDPWIPPVLAGAGAARWLAANLVVVVVYFGLGGIVSRFFAAYGLFPAPIWLSTGVAMVAAMVGGTRLFAGIFLGSFVTNAVLFAPPLHVTTIISVGNALGPVAAALVMRGLRPPSGLFTSLYGVVSFVFCSTFLGPAIIAVFGAAALAIGEPFDAARFYAIWSNWWLSDSGGSLYLAPALLLWLGIEHEPDGYTSAARQGWSGQNLAVWCGIAAVSVALFLAPPSGGADVRGADVRGAFPFLLVVPLSWIALRMSLRSAYSLVTLVAVVATVATVAGFGPFHASALANPLQLVGTLVVLLSMSVLTISALLSERLDAESANRVKSMFLATTSHELRAPLNAIIGFSSIIGSAPADPAHPNHAEYARVIQSSSEHLLSLINDLLEMSRLEAGRIDLAEESVPLAQAVAAALDLFIVQARAKSIALETDFEAEAVIRADPKALRQILANLVSNAIKFTPEGGRVAVSTALAPGGDLVIRVSDSGIGIPADALERVFAPFERAHRGDTDGTGLGLSITRGLVALHGGRVTLDSAPGQGTIAIVILPASRIQLATTRAGRLAS